MEKKKEIPELDYSLRIDFDLLKKQKSTLIDLINMSAKPDQGPDLDGILILLDNIQDQAIDVHKLKF